MGIVQNIAESLQRGEDEKVSEYTARALAENIDAHTILNQGLIAGMRVVGQQFKEHIIFLPDVLLAAKAMHAGMEKLKPKLLKAEVPPRAKVVMGTVQGDLHDIGKNLVGIMLKGAGYRVIDLGKDVAPEQFIETARSEGARVIGLSALLTTTMTAMKDVADLLAARGLQGQIKLIIGGAPVSAEYAKEIGADGYGYDALRAVECVDGFMREV